jgi:hypothetical protein
MACHITAEALSALKEMEPLIDAEASPDVKSYYRWLLGVYQEEE